MASDRRSFNMDRAIALEFLEWIKLHAPQIKVEHVWAAFAQMVMETDDVEALLAFVGVGTPAERRRFAAQALRRIMEADEATWNPSDLTTPTSDTPEGRRLMRDHAAQAAKEAAASGRRSAGTGGRRPRREPDTPA